jgi:hypothetical protein
VPFGLAIGWTIGWAIIGAIGGLIGGGFTFWEIQREAKNLGK